MSNESRPFLLCLILWTTSGVQASDRQPQFIAIPLIAGDTQNDKLNQHCGPTGDPVLASVVRRWLNAKSKVGHFDAEFSMIRTDDVWKTQSYGHGQFAVDTTCRWFYRVRPHDTKGWRTETYPPKPAADE